MEEATKRERARYYLDYIDKEMTFTGVITTINLGSLIFIAERIFSNSSTFPEKLVTPWIFGTAIVLIVTSTCLLIRHRSNLAFYYGQISLTIYSPTFTNRSITHWLEQVDAWSFWNEYLIGMGLLYNGIFLLGLAFYSAMLPTTSLVRSFFVNNEIGICLIIIVIGVIIRWFTMLKLRSDYPNNPLSPEENYTDDVVDE